MSASDPLGWAGSAAQQSKVVHVSGDFPDPIEEAKTQVIRRFIDLTAGSHSHRVISLNRCNPADAPGLVSGLFAGRLEIEREPFEYGEAWKYRAPPLGAWHRRNLRQLGEHIAERLRNDPPDLLVAHKLTIEGIAVERAAQLLNRPFAVLIQGNTDDKILGARPDLRRHLERIFHQAAVAISLAPWSLEAVEARLGKRSGPTAIIPAATDLDEPRAPSQDGSSFVSLFHLRHRRVKNLYGLLEATRLLRTDGITHPLEIIGGGDQTTVARCERMAASVGDVFFVGEGDRHQVSDRLNRATALVMPSRRESFGLAFVEALFAGTPIIYPRGAAIDGYFDELPFALPVEARDHADIARAMRHALEHEREIKEALAEWQGSADARRFTRAAIAQQFSAALDQALLR